MAWRVYKITFYKLQHSQKVYLLSKSPRWRSKEVFWAEAKHGRGRGGKGKRDKSSRRENGGANKDRSRRGNHSSTQATHLEYTYHILIWIMFYDILIMWIYLPLVWIMAAASIKESVWSKSDTLKWRAEDEVWSELNRGMDGCADS